MGLLDFLKDVDVKDKVDDFWDYIDDPIKNVLKFDKKILGATLSGLDKPRGAAYGGLKSILDETPNNSFEEIIKGFKHPEQYQPNTGNKLADIGLSAALDPITYIPAANLTKLKLLKPLAPVLAPIAGSKAGAVKRVGAELATNVAARTGSEVGTELTKDTPLAGVGGILGGLTAGGITASRFGGALSNKIPEGTQLPKMTDDQLDEEFLHIADSVPSTITKYETSNGSQWDTHEQAIKAMEGFYPVGTDLDAYVNAVKVPNPFAPEFEYVERDIPILLDNNTQIIERGQLVYSNKEQARFDADPQMQSVDATITQNVYNLNAQPAFNDVYHFANSWLGSPEVPRLQLEDSIQGNKQLIKNIRNSPESIQLREALWELNPDGYTTLYRGESHIVNGKYVPQYPENQIAQGYSSWPRGARLFTHTIDNLDIPMFANEQIIMKVQVPNDDILIAPYSSNFSIGEHEVIVLERSRISNEDYKAITGIEIDTPVTASYQVMRDSTNPVAKFDTEEEAINYIQQSSILTPDEKVYLDSIPPQLKELGEQLWAAPTTNKFYELQSKYDKLSSDYLDLSNRVSGKLTVKKTYFGRSVVPFSESTVGQIGAIETSPTMLGFAGTQQERKRATQTRRRERGREKRDERKTRSSLENVTLIPFRSSLEDIENIIPINLTKQNAGNELVQAVVGEPVTPITQQQYITPPISGDASMEKYHNLLTSKGIDKKVASQLESMSAKDRKDVADLLINEQAAHGIPDDLVRLIVQGYEKVGITDQAKIAKLNNMLRGMWATGDGSWFGIQGLLSIPRMLVKGDIKDAFDTLTIPMMTLTGNKTVMTKYIRRVVDNLPPDAPSLFDAQQAGLHLAFLKGNVDFNFTFIDKLPFFKPDEAFMAAGDVARISMFYNEWRRYGTKGSIEQIAAAVNRATGVSSGSYFGNIGSFALFAPRFFQSQLEVIAKAFSDGTIEGTLARRQLLALIGTGTALTFAANYVRGYSPFGVDLEDIQGDNPLEVALSIVENPNFMRIRNISGSDISVFGPWDSLLKLMVHLGSGDLGYARTKLGPLASLMTNIINKETFIGDPVQTNPYKILGDIAETAKNLPANLAQGDYSSPGDVAKSIFNAATDIDTSTNNTIKSLFLPFAWQEVGREAPINNVLNFFGVKNSPLSRTETIDVNMTNLGLDPNDQLDRHQYLTEHPEYRSVATEEARAELEYRNNIQSRRDYNEQDTLDNSLTLVEFRENRKILSRELRAKIDTLNRGRSGRKINTQADKWIQSYFEMFEQSQDRITHDIDSETFDKLQARWIEANGPAALDYMNRYLQIDKGEIELQYLQDMQQLDKLGYFDTQKYTSEVYELSGLTDSQIENYRNRVSAARSVNPQLAKRSFKQSLREILGDELTEDQIWALNRAGSQRSENPDIEAMKDLFPHLFQWFNPKAVWSTYLEAKGEPVELSSPVLAIPRIR